MSSKQTPPTPKASNSKYVQSLHKVKTEQAPPPVEGAPSLPGTQGTAGRRGTSVFYGKQAAESGGPFAMNFRYIREASARMNSMAWGGLVIAAGVALSIRYMTTSDGTADQRHSHSRS
eukprot:TRINITY_DN3387_c0_g1_i3.p1 TRINITY_DN3387_c0_g1~~TRINITY_DN3387_c0_g1_i3.p1  ORF type:complete len:118 (+),score=1.52 TRINITY_DN3387_c0_g1_i3:97-450(+)